MGHNIKITLIKKIQLVEKWSQAFAVWDWYPWVLWVTSRVFKVWPAGQWEPLVTVGRPVGATTKHSRTGYFPHSLYLTAQSKTKGAFVFIYNTSNILTTHQPQPTTTTEAYVWAFFFWDFSFRLGKCVYIYYIHNSKIHMNTRTKMGLGPALGVHRVVATCGWVMFAKVIYISVKLNLGTKATWKRLDEDGNLWKY